MRGRTALRVIAEIAELGSGSRSACRIKSSRVRCSQDDKERIIVRDAVRAFVVAFAVACECCSSIGLLTVDGDEEGRVYHACET